MAERIKIDVAPSERVTAIAYPAAARQRADIRLILAHGAGANQTSDFMVHYATALAARGIDTVTFNFLYTEKGKRLPDRPDKLEACYGAVIRAANDGAFGKKRGRLAIGGKSMGGRIASHMVAQAPADDDGIAALVFLGYPLHPPGDPDKLRAKHLADIRAPMLFVQGSRDAFGTPDELRPILRKLKAPADLYAVDGGGHSLDVPKRGARPQDEVDAAIFDEIARWLQAPSSKKNR